MVLTTTCAESGSDTYRRPQELGEPAAKRIEDGSRAYEFNCQVATNRMLSKCTMLVDVQACLLPRRGPEPLRGIFFAGANATLD
jgi:hypothetical protein